MADCKFADSIASFAAAAHALFHKSDMPELAYRNDPEELQRELESAFARLISAMNAKTSVIEIMTQSIYCAGLLMLAAGSCAMNTPEGQGITESEEKAGGEVWHRRTQERNN
jgi:hypothetical protein